MQTDNLNEMIQPDLNKNMKFIEIEDPVDKNTVISPHINPETQIVSKVNIPEILAGSYEPESEEALITYAANIHNRVQTYSISGYWEIGRSINAFYKGKYGTHELERIAQAIGIGRDTLNKMIKFAKQYSREQVQALLSGVYPMSWFHISQNLSVAPDRIIQVYQEAEDPKQFHNDIMKFKSQRESQRQSGKSSISAPAFVSESTESRTAENEIVDEAHDQTSPVNMIQAPNDDSKEICALREENKKLQEALEHKEYQVNQMQELFHESALILRNNDKLIEKLKRTIKQVHDMVENEYDPVNILAQIDWCTE